MRGRWEVRAPFRKSSSSHEAKDCQSLHSRKTGTPIPLSPIIRSDCRSGARTLKARIESNLTGRRRLSATPCPDSPSRIGRLFLRSQREDASTLYGSAAADSECFHSMVTNAVLCPANIGARFMELESLFMAAWLGSAEVEASLVGKGPRSGSSISPSEARKSENVAFAIGPAFDRPVSRSFRWDFFEYRKIRWRKNSTVHRRGEGVAVRSCRRV